jgi:ribosomal protein L7/L12
MGFKITIHNQTFDLPTERDEVMDSKIKMIKAVRDEAMCTLTEAKEFTNTFLDHFVLQFDKINNQPKITADQLFVAFKKASALQKLSIMNSLNLDRNGQPYPENAPY